MSISETYLISAKKQFAYYKTLGEKAMEQLPPLQLFYSHNENTNSIWVIVKHLHGNMLSRWTDFLTTDGEKKTRNRDSEFDEALNNLGELYNNLQSKEKIQSLKRKLIKKWDEGWQCLFNALDELNDKDLLTLIYIRNEGHTVIDAINRQLAHYAYHAGQIVFYAKQLKTEQWQSLSIPKNESANYNAEKFLNPRSQKHFTDDELDKLK